MEIFNQEQRQRIVEALTKAKAVRPCPRCGNGQFSLLDGYFTQPIQSNSTGLVLGGPAIPSAVVICTQCGYMAQHALGTLNLLDKTDQPKEGVAK